MAYGTIEYNEDGLPKCELCGEFFSRVLTHVRQKHEMNERDYKVRFGLPFNLGICSTESAQMSRNKTLDNYDICVTQNLLEGGRNNRYKKGAKGRTKEQVSEHTRLLLSNKGKSKTKKVIEIKKKRLPPT